MLEDTWAHGATRMMPGSFVKFSFNAFLQMWSEIISVFERCFINTPASPLPWLGCEIGGRKEGEYGRQRRGKKVRVEREERRRRSADRWMILCCLSRSCTWRVHVCFYVCVQPCLRISLYKSVFPSSARTHPLLVLSLSSRAGLVVFTQRIQLLLCIVLMLLTNYNM